MKKQTKKALALLTACAMSASMLAGCGGGAASSSAAASTADSTTTSEAAAAPAADGETSIRVVTFFAGSDQWAPTWKEVIQDYMDANPGVTIVDESQPTAGANDMFRTKIQADIAAKTPSDLMLFFNGADGDMVMDSDLYVDLKPYMDADPEWAANLKPSAMEAGQKDGMQYCIPYIGYYEGLLYNKDLFDQYGLAEPTTWENILDCIDTFKANDITPISISMMKPSYMVELFLLSQVGTDGQKNYFDDSWIPALDCIKELYDRGAFPADTMTMTEDDVRVLFADDKAAMMINGSWTVSGLKDQDGMRMISVPTLPGGTGGSNVVLSGFGSGWYMSKEAAERDDATLKFLKYLTSPEVMSRFIAVGGSPAITCDAPEGATPLEVSAIDMLNTATSSAPACDSQVTREAWLALTEPGIQYIVTGQSTPAEILAQARALQ